MFENLLAERSLFHLHVGKRGTAVTIASGGPTTPEPEARLTHLSRSSWRLDFHHHSGRWDRTPFAGDMTSMVDTAAGMRRLDDFSSAGS
jgi:hypothetical protein